MQPYTLAASSLEPSEWRTLTSLGSGIAVTAGVVSAVVFAVAGIVVGVASELGRCLLVIAVLAPGLTLQEFWRTASFAARRARTAAANDFLWALGQTAAFATLLLTTHITAAGSLIAWGAGAWLAAAIGSAQLSIRPRFDARAFQSARQWVGVGTWFTGVTAASSIGLYAVAAIVALEAGNHDLGLFRVVQGSLFGPVQLVTIGADSVFLPHLVRSTQSTKATGLAAAVRFSLAMTVAVTAYGIVLLLSGHLLLVRVFGSAYGPAAKLIFPMLMAFAIGAAGHGASVLLRARSRGRALLTMQLSATAAQTLAVILLVRPYGVLGATWGYAIGSAVAISLSWFLVLRTHPTDLGSGAGPATRQTDDATC